MEKAAAFNNSEAHSPNSFGMGYYSKVYGRPLKCTNLNWSNKSLTIDSS